MKSNRVSVYNTTIRRKRKKLEKIALQKNGVSLTLYKNLMKHPEYLPDLYTVLC